MMADEELYVHHPEFREWIERKYTGNLLKQCEDTLKREKPEHLWSDHALNV